MNRAPHPTQSRHVRQMLLLAVASGLCFACSKPAPEEPEAARDPHTPHTPTRDISSSERGAQRTLSSRDAEGHAVLPDPVASILEALRADSDLSFRQRIHALQHKFYDPAPLTRPEIDRLLAVVQGSGDLPDLRPQALLALQNECLNLLSLRLEDPSRLITVLEALQADPDTNTPLRDYATQFLTSLQQGDDPARAVHWKAVRHATSSGEVTTGQAHLGSTALLHLLADTRQHSTGKSTDLDRLKQSALRIASRDDLPHEARLTALQVCGQLKVQKAADLAMELSRSNDASFPLRIAAVATLGQLRSDEATVAYLKTLLDSPNTRLRAPAQAALETIYEKQTDHNPS